MTEGCQREQTIRRLMTMLDTSPPYAFQRSPYVAQALQDLLLVPPIEELSYVVEQLLDDRWGSLERLDRDALVHALDHIRRLACE